MTATDKRFESISDVVASTSLSLAGAADDQLDEVIDAALRAIGEHEQADRAYVTLYSTTGKFHNSHEWVAEGVAPHRPSIVGFDLAEFPWSVNLSMAGEVWHCPDVAGLPDAAAAERDSFGRFGVRSVLQVPMRNASRTIGVVGFNHLRSHRDWSPASIELVRRAGETIGFALLRREMMRDLREARLAAERANRAKDLFLSQISHELMTPLHAILGFAELLDTPDRPTHERAAVHQIIDAGQRLQVLADELLQRAGQPAQSAIE